MQTPDAESIYMSKDTNREKLRIKEEEEIGWSINQRKKKNKLFLMQ